MLCSLNHRKLLVQAPRCVRNAGKDRAGIAAVLLLMLAGADRQDACTNYAQTRENLMRTTWYRQELRDLPEEMRHIISTNLATIGQAHDHLIETYDSAEAYLMSCGISKEDIAALKERLLG